MRRKREKLINIMAHALASDAAVCHLPGLPWSPHGIWQYSTKTRKMLPPGEKDPQAAAKWTFRPPVRRTDELTGQQVRRQDLIVRRKVLLLGVCVLALVGVLAMCGATESPGTAAAP